MSLLPACCTPLMLYIILIFHAKHTQQHTVNTYTTYSQARGKELVPLLADGNLVDTAWGAEQPPLPLAPLRVHAMEWAGQGVADKVAAMRAKAKGGWSMHALLLLQTCVAVHLATVSKRRSLIETPVLTELPIHAQCPQLLVPARCW